MCIQRSNPLSASSGQGSMPEEVLMMSYKVEACTKSYRHDWGSCPYVHKGELSGRRPPSSHLPILCRSSVHSTDLKEKCPLGANCPFAHNHFEYWLHPGRYRTSMCRNAGSCKRAICFFAHSEAQLRRTIYSGAPGEDADTPAAASEHAVAAAAAEAAGMKGAADACLTCITAFLMSQQRGSTAQEMLQSLLVKDALAAMMPEAAAAADGARASPVERATSPSNHDGSVCSAGAVSPSAAQCSSSSSSTVGAGSPLALVDSQAAISDAPSSKSSVCNMCQGPMVTTMKAAKAPAGMAPMDTWGGGRPEQVAMNATMLGALGMLSPEEMPHYMREVLGIRGSNELMLHGGMAGNGNMLHLLLQRQMAAAAAANASMAQMEYLQGGSLPYPAAGAAAVNSLQQQMLLQQLQAGVRPDLFTAGVQGPGVLSVGHELGMATPLANDWGLLNAASMAPGAMGMPAAAAAQVQRQQQQQQHHHQQLAATALPCTTSGFQAVAELQAALEVLNMSAGASSSSAVGVALPADFGGALAMSAVRPVAAVLGTQVPLALSATAPAGQLPPLTMPVELGAGVSDYAAPGPQVAIVSRPDIGLRPGARAGMLGGQQHRQAQALRRGWPGWQQQGLAPALLQAGAPVAAVQPAGVESWWQGAGAGHELGL